MRITADEIRLIAFVICALLIGSTVKHWRDIHRGHPTQQTFRVPAAHVGNETERAENEKQHQSAPDQRP